MGKGKNYQFEVCQGTRCQSSQRTINEYKSILPFDAVKMMNHIDTCHRICVQVIK